MRPIVVGCRPTELDLFIHQEVLEELRHSIAGANLREENLVGHGKLKYSGALSLIVWKFVLAGVPRHVGELIVESNNLDLRSIEVLLHLSTHLHGNQEHVLNANGSQ